MEYGLKCWSDNAALREALLDTTIWNYYSFLEIYAVPGSSQKTMAAWVKLKAPEVLIHAPHFAHNMNLSLESHFERNRVLFNEAKGFCEKLKAKYIILHLGTRGTLEEGIRQIKKLDFPKIIVENKPQIAVDGSQCVGTSPSDIQKILKECNIGFCLDIAHAIAYAAYHQLDYLKVLKEFIDLSPVHYHLCDGFISNTRDKHLNIGEGDYDFKAIFKLLPKDAAITLETKKKSDSDLRVLISEVEALKKYEPQN